MVDKIVQQYMKWRNNDIDDQATVSNALKLEEIHTFRLDVLHQSDDEMQLLIRNMFRRSTLCEILCLKCEQSTSIIIDVNDFISIAKNDNFDRNCQNSLENSEIRRIIVMEHRPK